MKIVKDEDLRTDKQQFDNLCSLVIAIPKPQLPVSLDRLKKINGLKLEYLFTT
jgi:hypothetical protein